MCMNNCTTLVMVVVIVCNNYRISNTEDITRRITLLLKQTKIGAQSMFGYEMSMIKHH